ncbi:MAG: glycosyltransferase family 4 protein [Methylomicrobium sp.]|nr:glycosyltransferase family 4 protein [Methylomicrobium sp.]
MPITSRPRRILYVENGIGYGGAIICLRHLVRNIDRSLFTPMVVTGRTGTQYQEIAKEALWKYITDRHIDIVGAHRAIDHLEWPDKIPGLRFVINQVLARTDDIANFLPFFIQLLWTAKIFKADLIHCNNEPLCNRAALLVGKILNIPTVCHVRGDQEGSRLMKWAFNLPDRFISVSHWVSESMQNKLQIPANKIDIIYDGIELDKLDLNAEGNDFRRIYNIGEKDFAVGLIGLLIPWKGQELFLDAANILKSKIPNLKMIIIGGTPDDCYEYEKMLKTRVKKEQLENIVIFTGHINNMPLAYNGIDIVVSASTSPEPLGTVVIESMAMARPLIGPKHGGAAEMMEHNKTGLLFVPKSPTSLAEQIYAFYIDSSLRSTISQNARSHALKTFAVDTHVRKVKEVYDGLLNNVA